MQEFEMTEKKIGINYLSRIILILFIISDLFGDKALKNGDSLLDFEWLTEDKSIEILKKNSTNKISNQETQEEREAREDRVATKKWNLKQKEIIAKVTREQLERSEQNRITDIEDTLDYEQREQEREQERELEFREDVKNGKADCNNRAKWEKENPNDYNHDVFIDMKIIKYSNYSHFNHDYDKS